MPTSSYTVLQKGPPENTKKKIILKIIKIQKLLLNI